MTRKKEKEPDIILDAADLSAEEKAPDHLLWWAGFTELVSKIPKNPEQCRLSDAPIHRVHGSILSIRDCAARAIDLAYGEGLDQVAHKYEEQAKRLTATYDSRIYTKVSTFLDKKMIKYLLITIGCVLFALVFIAINSSRDTSSFGLLAIVVISLAVSFVSAVLFMLLLIKKKRILAPEMREKEGPDPKMP